MPDFVTQYAPPGVYIEEAVSPLSAPVGVLPTLVAIVGPGVGYRTYTEAVVLTGTTAMPLTKLGIDPAEVEVRSADDTLYVVDTDYALVVGGGEDEDEDTLTDNTLTIARVALGDIGDGDTVYVTYRYTDEDYYEPLLADDYDDVKDAFGEPLDLINGTITSPLSLAAKVAFENGASQVLLVAAVGDASATTRDDLADAYAKIEANSSVTVVVPLPVGITGTVLAPGDTTAIGLDLLTHVEDAAEDAYYRIGIIGYETTVTVDPATIAEAIASSRIMLAWPNKMSYYNGYSNQNIEVAGYYLAAAYAGQFASRGVQYPLTKKVIRGFAGIPASMLQTMSATVKNAWSDSGVAVTEVNRNGRLTVRHGTSTDRSSIQTREISLTRAKDSMVLLIADTLEDAELIGSPIVEETPARVKGVVAGVLETVKRVEIIVDYIGLKVRQRSIDPSVIEVKFQYQPAYPLNYIVVSFSINTQTGEVSTDDTAVA